MDNNNQIQKSSSSNIHQYQVLGLINNQTETDSTPKSINLSEALQEQTLLGIDFGKFQEQLTLNFSKDYTVADSIEYKKAKQIFEYCLKEKWSRREFHKRLEQFIKSQKYPTFTVADFLDYERVKLYDHNWYLKQQNLDYKAKFERYIINGEYYYRFKGDKYIPGLEQDESFNKAYEYIPGQNKGNIRENNVKYVYYTQEECNKYNKHILDYFSKAGIEPDDKNFFKPGISYRHTECSMPYDKHDTTPRAEAYAGETFHKWLQSAKGLNVDERFRNPLTDKHIMLEGVNLDSLYSEFINTLQ